MQSFRTIQCTQHRSLVSRVATNTRRSKLCKLPARYHTIAASLSSSGGNNPLQSGNQSSSRGVQAASAASFGGALSNGLGGSDPGLPLHQGPFKLTQQEKDAFAKMMRLHNIVPSLMLVFLGAWAGSGRDMAVFGSPIVWGMSFISAGVTVASMVLNDYFDYTSGVDAVNAPHKPLPSGTFKPDLAVLLGSSIYFAVLIAACFMESPWLRTIIALSAGATLLYTPFFKRVTAVKNAVVASIIAAAPISGALAAGASLYNLQKLASCTVFAFAGIMYREILMDINDMQGDAAQGVRTVPVLLGRAAALAIGTGTMTVGALAAVWGLVANSSLPAAFAAVRDGLAAWTHLMVPRAAGALLVLLLLAQVLRQAVQVYRSGFNRQVVDGAVADCLKPLGLGIIILGAVA